MIIVMDIHQVIGERELDFDDTYKDAYTSAIAVNDDARLLWFGWLPHGAGEGYEAVTLTAVRDLEAWDRLSERLRYGDLAEWATAVDGMRYGLMSTVNVIAPWSSLADLSLSDVPVEVDEEKPPSLLRLDSIRPAESVSETIDALGAAAKSSDRDLLDPIGCWSSALGDMGGDAVHVLYRVGDRAALGEALDNQDANATWPGSLAAAAGLTPDRVRFIRATRWSPLS